MDKTAIISGAGGALGNVLVDKFLEAGYTTEGLYHSHPQSRDNSLFSGRTVNLMNENDSTNVVQEILKQRGEVHTIVCSAGGFEMGDIEKTDFAGIQKQIQLNFLTAYNLVRPVFQQMKKQGYGHIFLIGSRQGMDSVHSAKTVAYGLSKSMLFHLAGILNKDSDGKVVVSMIVPSTLDTAANRQSMPDADFSKWVSPVKIAETILFYSSDAASDIRQPVIKIFNQS